MKSPIHSSMTHFRGCPDKVADVIAVLKYYGAGSARGKVVVSID